MSSQVLHPSDAAFGAKNLLIHVSVPEQKLRLLRGLQTVAEFPVSTAVAGVGTAEGSLQTPPGLFRICEKIGEGAPEGAVFRSRRLTGETGSADAPEDQVLSRILWLDGLEPSNANTRERFIYIHGTNKESLIGQPAGNGCIRMRNVDIIQLFDLVETGALVYVDDGFPRINCPENMAVPSGF